MLLKLQKPAAILFDWDGTLVDSLPALHSYYNHVLGIFSKPHITLNEARKTIRRSAREVFPEIFGDKAEKAFEAYYDIVGKTHLLHLKPFLSSEGFLQKLAELEIPLGIVSNKKHSFLIKEINHLGWDKYLVSNIGAGAAAKDKPAPDSILMAIEALGLSADQDCIWYVGDTETDIMAGQAAGCQTVFIEHGLGTQADMESHGLHSVCAKNLEELAGLVENFF